MRVKRGGVRTGCLVTSSGAAWTPAVPRAQGCRQRPCDRKQSASVFAQFGGPLVGGRQRRGQGMCAGVAGPVLDGMHVYTNTHTSTSTCTLIHTCIYTCTHKQFPYLGHMQPHESATGCYAHLVTAAPAGPSSWLPSALQGWSPQYSFFSTLLRNQTPVHLTWYAEIWGELERIFPPEKQHMGGADIKPHVSCNVVFLGSRLCSSQETSSKE